MKIAVIGCGYWGPNLVRNFAQSNKVQEVICCDLDQKRLDYIKNLYPQVKILSNYKEILAQPDLDGVAIATPVKTHYKITKDFLSQGKHVLVEKPLTHSYETGLELVKLAEENQRILMVGHTFEYTAAVNKIKEIIQKGDLGKILYISCSRLNLGPIRQDVNALWDLAPHDISIILYLIDSIPVSANCQGIAYLKKGVHDVCTLTLYFENNCMAIIHTSWLDPNKVRRMTIVGDKKMAVYDDVEPLEKIKIYDKGVDRPEYSDSFGEFQLSYRYGDTYSPRVVEVEPLKIECDHFIDCIKQGLRPKTDGEKGLEVVKVLEAASRSLNNGGGRVNLN